jgi:hypothetical protein
MQHIKCQIIQNCQKIWETSGNFALISNFGILTFDLLNYILLFRNLKKRQKIFYYTACECVELVHGASTWSVWAERVECVEWVRGESECGLQVGARSECAEWVRGASARSECKERVRKASAQSECAKRVRKASARSECAERVRGLTGMAADATATITLSGCFTRVDRITFFNSEVWKKAKHYFNLLHASAQSECVERVRIESAWSEWEERVSECAKSMITIVWFASTAIFFISQDKLRVSKIKNHYFISSYFYK